jgi:hypothetical protein
MISSGTPASTPFSHLLFGPFPVFGSSSVSLCFGAMGSCHRPAKGPTVDHRSWGITSRQHMALPVSLGYPWISKSINVISMLCHQGLFPKWWPQFRAQQRGTIQIFSMDATALEGQTPAVPAVLSALEALGRMGWGNSSRLCHTYIYIYVSIYVCIYVHIIYIYVI